MKADREEAPNYLNRSIADKIKQWIIPSILGCAITFGMLYAGISNLSLETPNTSLRTKTAPRENVEEFLQWKEKEQNWTRSEQARADQQQKEMREQFWKSIEEPEETKKPKQTVFNDKNYIPRGTVNTASMSVKEVEPPRRQTQGLVVKGIKEKTRIRDYCPYPKGSIEHRNCRQRWGLEVRR